MSPTRFSSGFPLFNWVFLIANGIKWVLLRFNWFLPGFIWFPYLLHDETMFFWALTTAYPTLRTISTPLANLLRPQSDWPILEVDRVLPSFYRVSSPTIGFDLRLRGWATLPGCLLRFITGSLCFFFPFFSIRFGCVSIAEDCGRGRCHRSPQKRADFVINAGLLFFPFFFPVFTDEEVLLFFFDFRHLVGARCRLRGACTNRWTRARHLFVSNRQKKEEEKKKANQFLFHVSTKRPIRHRRRSASEHVSPFDGIAVSSAVVKQNEENRCDSFFFISIWFLLLSGVVDSKRPTRCREKWRPELAQLFADWLTQTKTKKKTKKRVLFSSWSRSYSFFSLVCFVFVFGNSTIIAAGRSSQQIGHGPKLGKTR